MAYVPNWIARTIFVPVADMTPLTGADYQLAADSFWREIRRLEWETAEGLWAPQIMEHRDPVTIGASTSAPTNLLINGYKIVFDPLAEKVFLNGDNNNIIDSFVFNGVSVVPSNSFGNTVTVVGSGLDAGQSTQLEELWQRHGLDIANPARFKPDGHVIPATGTAIIDQEITKDGDDIIVTRKPDP